MKIAEHEIAIENIEGEMNKQINGIKMIADQEAQPHHDQISKLEKEIKEFVEEHREDLGKKKTKDLTFWPVRFPSFYFRRSAEGGGEAGRDNQKAPQPQNDRVCGDH